MAIELSKLAQLLEASLDPRQNKQAELALRIEEKSPNFAVSLLHIVAGESFSSTTRLAGALCFKNYLKRNWTDIDGNHLLPEEEVAIIKQEIIGLMIVVPPNIQFQVGDAVGIIADSDFWRNWDTLVDDLVSRLTADNPSVNNGVLQVAHSIFKRWRPLFRSDELFTEINHVLEKFGGPFLSLLISTDKSIEQSRNNRSLLLEFYNTLNLEMKLFFDLSCQDLPPIFEENLSGVATLWQKYLTFDEKSLRTDSIEEAGPLEFVKSGILEVLGLFVQKYEDAFADHVDAFVQSSWNLLTAIGAETKYDILASKALKFLTSVSRVSKHVEPFNDESNMGQVIEKVILPNLRLRNSDMELFEDEPIEFIRRDLEGSDSDTRRRAATDFLRGLMLQFDSLVTTIVVRYVNHYLSDYSSNPTANWKSKDTAVYLFSSIAAKGAATSREGVKTVNQRVNIIDFFQENIADDMVTEIGIEPILKVDAIKYLYTFRSQMNREQWSAAFPLLVRHLGSPNYVVYSYTAIAVERVLALVDENHQPVVDKEMVIPLAKDLLEHLFRLIERNTSPDKTKAATEIQENEFLMRCLMRVLIVIREGLLPLTDVLLKHFVEIINLVYLNPSNPRFCYYLFEAVGAVIKFAGHGHSTVLADTLYHPFVAILDSDISDFMPYVFQLFSALLEADPSAVLPDYFKALIPRILKVDFWVSKGNVPALVRFLSSTMTRAASEFVDGNQIEPVLGIFKQLLSTKANEIQAFELLESVLTNFHPDIMQNYYLPIMQMVLTKLQDSKSESFSARFVRLYHLISAKVDEGLGADFFINVIEQVQSGIYVPIYLNIILPGTPKLARPLDRKIAVISLTKTLTRSTAFADTYKKGWSFTCDRLLELLINPPVVLEKDEIIAENDVEDMSFGVGYTQLVTIRKSPMDHWPTISNVKTFVSEELKESDARLNGRIGEFLQQRLTAESRQALVAYMQG